jgi:hypothetical protein
LEEKRWARLILFAAVFLAYMTGGGVFAQEAEQGTEIESSYRLDESGRILQRISWTRSNAYYYEVEIEQQDEEDEEEWKQIAKERTGELFVEVSLAPGMYRYRILSYNVLGRVAATTDWVGIRVYATRDPLIERTIPEAYYVENMEKDFSLVLEGLNLMTGAEVYLSENIEGARQLIPASVQYSEDEESITVLINTADLVLGPYNIVVINPGRLQTVYEGFRVTFRQAVDTNVSLGYVPLIPFYGYIFNSFSSPLYPVSFYARVNRVFYKRLWGFMGAEFTPQIAILETEGNTYKVHGTMASFTFDALLQYWFNRRTMALNTRLGGGFTVIGDIYYAHDDGSVSEDVVTVLPLMNLGFSFEWVLWRDLFAEAGFEYIQHFSARSPAPGILKLTVGAGWRF